MPRKNWGIPELWCRRCDRTYRQRDMSVSIGYNGRRAFLPCPTCRADLYYLYPGPEPEPKERDPLCWLEGTASWETD